jgi:hypothetical protein
MKPKLALVMLRRLFFAAALLLVLSSRALASPIELLFTFNHYTPIGGEREPGISFTFFESATNGWPGAFPPQPFLAQGHTALPPGVTQTTVSLDAESLNHVYFSAYGSYLSGPELQFVSLFVAAPPSGPVPGSLALGYGPPWISLSNLGAGLSGELQVFYGQSYGPMGTWELTPETPLPVPEPGSLLLFGSGIATLAARKYRRAAKRAR